MSLQHSSKLAARRLTAVKKKKRKEKKKDKVDLKVVLRSLNRGFIIFIIKNNNHNCKKRRSSFVHFFLPLTALCDCAEYIPDLVIIY